ncbi:hypothetical protein WOB59_00555 [Methylocystis sp. IM4]|uniref:hypothetical protein n=1 Tax=Methylocystis sp. IM4 TaxID=3136560 RepID=UPI003119E3D4
MFFSFSGALGSCPDLLGFRCALGGHPSLFGFGFGASFLGFVARALSREPLGFFRLDFPCPRGKVEGEDRGLVFGGLDGCEGGAGRSGGYDRSRGGCEEAICVGGKASLFGSARSAASSPARRAAYSSRACAWLIFRACLGKSNTGRP